MDSFNESWVVPIAKVELSRPKVSEIRPIALSSTLCKVLTGFLTRWLYRLWPSYVVPSQCGFMPGRGTDLALSMLEGAMFSDAGCVAGDACILGHWRAFPTISQTFLREVLKRTGTPAWLLQALDALYSNLSARFMIQACMGRSFRLNVDYDRVALRQVAIASDPLFRWANSRLPGDSFLISFADDLACVSRKMESEGAGFLLELEICLFQVAGLRLNHAKICGIALLSGNTIGAENITYIKKNWEFI